MTAFQFMRKAMESKEKIKHSAYYGIGPDDNPFTSGPPVSKYEIVLTRVLEWSLAPIDDSAFHQAVESASEDGRVSEVIISKLTELVANPP